MTIHYIDRLTKEEKTEQVYGKYYIDLLYGNSWGSKILSHAVACSPLLSRFYGALQKSKCSKRKIQPFIEKYDVDTAEFLKTDFSSFNDFFIRKLKPRSLSSSTVILPADGRYLVFPNLSTTDGFFVKGKKFTLETLLQDSALAKKYAQGSMVLARLAPVDYHRFHFPVDCIPEKPQPIRGKLFSVNPIALRKNIGILAENKRMITPLQTKPFGTILFIEVGATFVGTIHETFTPNQPYSKGDEKGYFSFGGSSLILLFEPGKIEFDQDLIEASERKIEVLGKMGQSLGSIYQSHSNRRVPE
jgi:phosphatidylserine decarboxylase